MTYALAGVRIGNVLIKKKIRDFPVGPVAKPSHSQGRGPGFDPWSEN